MAALRHKWDTANKLPKEGRRPSNPEISTHLWKTNVPNSWRSGYLPIGKHTIEIRVTDMFRRSFEDEYTYEIVKPLYIDGHP